MQVSRDEAISLGAKRPRSAALGERRGTPSKFKLDIIQRIPEGEEISLYTNGDFIDLCAGPHVMRTGNVGAFKLTHVSSTYYKGDEKNPQLQRIYGTAFKNKTEMEAYFTMLEEAKKRDHRKLGKELELFTFDDDVGPGLAMWLPRGTVLVEELEKLAKETEFAAGYERVRTPHLARENMYLTSGHLPYYADSMFPPMVLDETPRVGERTRPRVLFPATRRKPPNRTAPKARHTPSRRLPHFERPWGKYMATFSAADRRTLTDAERDIVLACVLFPHRRSRYELYAACVMPDHVHLLFEPQIKSEGQSGEMIFYSLAELLQSVKSVSAHKINELRCKSGAVWDRESFDRLIRSEADLQEKYHYICANPEKSTSQPDNRWIWTFDIHNRAVEPTAAEAFGASPNTARESRALPIQNCLLTATATT